MLHILAFIFFLTLEYLWWNLCGNEFSCNSEQVCDVLGFSYEEPNPERTRGGKFQSHLSFRPTYQFNSPLFQIYGSPCDNTYEARKSALIHPLAYISEVLNFKIGYFNYMDYLFKKNGGSVRKMEVLNLWTLLRLKYWCTLLIFMDLNLLSLLRLKYLCTHLSFECLITCEF
jgi:hypothetical protein